MAVFRIEKTRDYTVMSNHHLRNTELSLKAKGLLSLMLSLPENWDYTTKGLARICKDGVDSICAGVRELEEQGYVIRERVRNPNGQLGAIEYTILEQPRPLEREKPERENPVLDNPILGSPVLEEPEQGKPAQLNTKDAQRPDPGHPWQRQELFSKEGNPQRVSGDKGRYHHLRPGGGVFPPGPPSGRAGHQDIAHQQPVREPDGFEPQLLRGRQPAGSEIRFYPVLLRAGGRRPQRSGAGGKDTH